MTTPRTVPSETTVAAAAAEVAESEVDVAAMSSGNLEVSKRLGFAAEEGEGLNFKRRVGEDVRFLEREAEGYLKLS